MTTTAAPPPGPWIADWLSGPRWNVYLTAADGDEPVALALYEWNTQLSAAVLHDLAHIEVALRNAYDRALSTAGSPAWQGHWTANAQTVFAPLLRTRRKRKIDVNRKPRESLERAVREVGGPTAPPGKVVAQLMFGFWRYLSTSAHEVSLWRPHLHHAFPAGTSRPWVDTRVGEIHDLRNRVAHHEPLLRTPVGSAHMAMVDLAGKIVPDLAAYMVTSSTVMPLARQCPCSHVARTVCA